MLQKRRTAYDILVEILECCRDPISKSDLYHTIKTSGDIFYRWLAATLNYKLLANRNGKYQTTVKGIQFLNTWAQVQAFLKEE